MNRSTPLDWFYHPITPSPARSGWARRLASGTLAAALLLANPVARLHAQSPVNQLHFSFMDPQGGTTTTSDTALNPSAIITTLTMYNALSPAATVDLHGAVGSGVTNSGVTSVTRAIDFTADIIPTQTNQPANSKPAVVANGSAETGNNPASGSGNAALAVDLADTALLGLGTGGTIGPFAATIWAKLNAPIPAGETVCPRIWILNSTTGAAGGLDTGNAAAPGSLGLKWQQNNQVAFSMGSDNPTLLGTLPSGTFPTNTWMFFAVVYDNTNFFIYYGTAASSPSLIGQVGGAANANRTYTITTSGTLAVGNRRTATTYNTRGLDGWLNDFRFYSGIGDAAFVEGIWASALGNPPVITSIYPDGTLLLQGTNTLSFTASSPNGNNITNVDVVLNGADVSSQLAFVTNGTPGTSTNLSVSYPNLQLNRSSTATITLRDSMGLIGTASFAFDTYNSTNFIWEAEEFDHDSGQFIDNPLYTSYSTNGSYYQLDSTEGVDTHKGSGNPAANASDYRVEGDTVSNFKTQTPASTDINRQKFLDDIAAGDSNVVDHIVGNWQSSEWQNYTKTFPTGRYNVYGRLSSSSSSTIAMAKVTGGAGTSSQTLTNIGAFSVTGSSLNNYSYIPLRDTFGNLAVVDLSGVNTVRFTTGGGANANFYMLVPANTNLPSITGVYPNGTVLFQPTNKLVFTASSAATISTNSIRLSVNGTDVSSNLVFSGSSTSWNVSYPGLASNQTYAVVINVTDANGNSASSTLNIDTYAPAFVWEAEDFDFDPNQSPVPDGTGKRYIDNPVPTTSAAANSYFGQIAAMGIDAFNNSNPQVSANNYRPNDIIATPPITDAARQIFLTANAPDYNLGFLHPGYWEDYTRTFPAGTYNIYGRLANGQDPAAVINLDLIQAGWGTANQIKQIPTLGTFTVPNHGWSAYGYVPLIDRFGNYANVTLSDTNTLRTTEQAAVNINFYMLLPARTDLPRIDAVYPDGSVLMQKTNTLSFVASSPIYGINTTNIQVTLNGVNISSNLVFTGSSASWNVSYPALLPSTAYTAGITVTDLHQQVATTTVTFDTFSPNNFTFEAEDFDFDPTLSPAPNGTGNRYIDNPVLSSPAMGALSNSYYAQVAGLDIDVSSLFGNQHPGTYVWRPSDYVVTELGTDTPRQKYLDAQLANLDPSIVDYDVAFWTNGAFINWTRTFPAGNFYVYGRLAGGNGAFNLALSTVTSGWGTSSQTSQYLGTFRGSGASFVAWQWVPLINTNTGQRVALTLGGTNTFQMTADGNENANFFTLVPAAEALTLTATLSGANIRLSFETQTGLTYTLYYKNNLTDATWTPLGGSIAGDGTTKSVPDPISSKRFYRLGVQ
jgi:hypothetical protein